jgi:hypothetical protein
VNQYFLEGNRNSVAVSEDDIAEAVAYKDDIDACFVNDSRRRIIVRCQTDEAFAALFAGS